MSSPQVVTPPSPCFSALPFSFHSYFLCLLRLHIPHLDYFRSFLTYLPHSMLNSSYPISTVLWTGSEKMSSITGPLPMSAYNLPISQVQTLTFRNTELLGDFLVLLCWCLFLKSSLFNRLTAHPSRKQACHPSHPGSHCTPPLPTVLLYSLGKDTSY